MPTIFIVRSRECVATMQQVNRTDVVMHRRVSPQSCQSCCRKFRDEDCAVPFTRFNDNNEIWYLENATVANRKKIALYCSHEAAQLEAR
jgi:hypothetical protein